MKNLKAILSKVYGYLIGSDFDKVLKQFYFPIAKHMLLWVSGERVLQQHTIFSTCKRMAWDLRLILITE